MSSITQKHKLLILTLIIITYALMHMATKKVICEGDCETLRTIKDGLREEDYEIINIARCAYNDLDTICVIADNIRGAGTNWNTVADKTCDLATQNGLQQQYVLVMNGTTSGPDTLAKKQCP